MRYRKLAGWVGAWLAGASMAADATPVHYLVFEMDPAGRVSPVHYARVEMQATADAILAAQSPRAGRRDATLGYRLLQHGQDLGVHTIALPQVRGEFARDPGHDGNIEAARVDDAAPRAFVLRIPVDAADVVEFDSGASSQSYVLADLAARAATLRLASVPGLPTPQAPNAGAPGNRFDVLVLGDGYTAAQQANFASDAAAMGGAYFGITPHLEYQSFVNWTPVFTASAQSGADHPPYQAACNSSSCCSDPYAQDDPRAGQFVNTAFDATFCYGQTHRLLVVDYAKAFAAAASHPEWDEIIVIVNDPVYGGSGGTMSVASMHPSAGELVLHEMGHSFTDLADEYSTPYPGYPPCSDISGSSPCEANVTNQTDPGQVKWRAWFTSGNPIPTPPGTSGVGLFEGARYQSVGMYRPVDVQCEMQYLGMPFCAACREAYVKRLYAGGWGIPASGIDLIEPGSEVPASAQPVAYPPGMALRFGVDLLRPSVGTLAVEWRLDGVPLAGAVNDSYVFSQAGPTPATRTLELRVRDTSAYVAGSLPTRSRSWTIQVDTDRIWFDGFD